jgi:phosphopantothenoylcysteine decarboxylase
LSRIASIFYFLTHAMFPAAEEEWNEWNRIGDPVMHIELRDWADVVVIAPLSAHTLAKIANGLCDDTLSCVMRAWDYGHVRPGKPIILAPAMNTAMWEHPLTRKQLDTIVDFAKDAARRGGGLESSPAKVCIVEPQEKTLACGEVGTGALASVDNVIMTVQESLASMDL